MLVICPGPSISKYKEQIEKFERPWIAVNNIEGMFSPDYHLWVNKRRYKDHGHKMIGGKPVFGYKFDEKMIEHRPYETVHFMNDYLNEQGFVKINGNTIIGSGMTGGIVAGAWAVMNGATKLFYVGLDGFKEGQQSHLYKENRLSDMGKLMLLQKATFGCLASLSKMVPVKILTPTVYEEYHEDFFNDNDDEDQEEL